MSVTPSIPLIRGTGFMGFVGLGNCLNCTSHLVEYAANRGLARITRITRILGIFVYRQFSSGGRRYGNITGLRTQTGKFAVQIRSRWVRFLKETPKQNTASSKRSGIGDAVPYRARGQKSGLQSSLLQGFQMFCNFLRFFCKYYSV